MNVIGQESIYAYASPRIYISMTVCRNSFVNLDTKCKSFFSDLILNYM